MLKVNHSKGYYPFGIKELVKLQLIKDKFEIISG